MHALVILVLCVKDCELTQPEHGLHFSTLLICELNCSRQRGNCVSTLNHSCLFLLFQRKFLALCYCLLIGDETIPRHIHQEPFDDPPEL